MACHTPPGEPTQQFPDKIHLILMRFNFDESHQKELIKYHFLSAFAYSVTVAHAQTYQAPPPPPPTPPPREEAWYKVQSFICTDPEGMAYIYTI